MPASTVKGILHGGKTGHVYVNKADDCSLDPLFRGDGAAGKHVGAADRGRRAHAAGRQWRR